MRAPSRRTVLIAVAVGVVLLLAYALLPSPDRVFRAKVAALKAEGFAVTLHDFVGEAPPGAEEAAAEIQAAYDELAARRRPGDDEEMPLLGLPWVRKVTGPWDVDAMDPWERTATPEQMEALADWLDEARPFYDRVGDVFTRPAIRFPVKLDADGFPDVQHVRIVQNLQKLLSARSLAARDPADRIAACRDQLRFGRRLRPLSTIDVMVARAIEAGGIQAVRSGVESGALRVGDVRAAVDGELTPRPPGEREWVARSEIAWLADVWERVLRGWRPSWLPRPTALQRLGAFWASLVTRRDEEEWSSATATAQLAFWAAVARGERAWSGPDEAGGADATPRGALVMAPTLDRRLRQQESALVLARVALAVKAHRETTGDWPATLDDVRDLLGGAVPSDPFTSAPFRYELDGAAVRTSSVGRRPTDPDVTDEDRRERGLIWEFPR